MIELGRKLTRVSTVSLSHAILDLRAVASVSTGDNRQELDKFLIVLPTRAFNRNSNFEFSDPQRTVHARRIYPKRRSADDLPGHVCALSQAGELPPLVEVGSSAKSDGRHVEPN